MKKERRAEKKVDNGEKHDEVSSSFSIKLCAEVAFLRISISKFRLFHHAIVYLMIIRS